MTTTTIDVAARSVGDKYHDDLYVRDFPGDVGKIPSSTTDDLSQSPDIIPSGIETIADFKQRLVDKYAGPFDDYKNIEEGSTNFIYVRAKNLADHGQTGHVNLYWLEAPLAPRPRDWISNRIRGSNGGVSVRLPNVASRAISVADEPFAWRPPTQKGHYCLIAQVVTEKTPNTITDKTDIRDFALWVANHPGIAWRNVLFVDLQKNDEEYTVRVVSPSPEKKRFYIIGDCIRMPDGTKVSMRIPAAGPNPPVDEKIVVGPKNVIAAVTDLPGHFTGTLHVRVEFPAGSKPDRPEFKLRELVEIPRDAEIDTIAVPPETVFGPAGVVPAHFNESRSALVRMGDYFINFR